MRCFLCLAVLLSFLLTQNLQAQIPVPVEPGPPIVVEVKPADDLKNSDPKTKEEGDKTDKKEDKKPSDDKKPADDKKAVAKVKTPEPTTMKFRMSSGSVFSGEPLFKEIKVKTELGDLAIPITDIISIVPGLDSRPDLAKKINQWVVDLTSQEFGKREIAKRELISLGPSVEDILREFITGKKAEQDKELEKILAQLVEIAFENEDEVDSVQKLRHKDKVVAKKFTILGKVDTKGYKINSKELGQLTINPNLLISAIRDSGQAPSISKRVKVDGTQHIAQRNFKNSRINVQKGDVIKVSATGMIIMTPWGSSARSTPAGQSRYGTYKSGIYAGALVAKIGSGSDFLIGASKKFTAKSSGTLYFGIGMNSSYKNYSFPGTYDLKVKVDRK